MIALFKMNDLYEDEIKDLLKDMGYTSASFYSINSILDQIMNPMVIITPAIFQKELAGLSFPIIPISFTIADIQKSIKNMFDTPNDIEHAFLASAEEIEWLRKERDDQSDDNGIQLSFFTEKLPPAQLPNRNCLAPIWMKGLFSSPHMKNLHFIKPSFASLHPYLQIAVSLVNFTEEMVKERYQVDAIVNSTHDGVIAVDRIGTIRLVNEHAKTILGVEGGMKGRNITEFIPQSDMLRVLETGKVERGDLAAVGGRQIVINRTPVIVKGKIVGAVSNFKEITDIQKVELQLRKKLHQTGLEAKYRLNDIVGETSEIMEAKELASKFAETESTVLITGESGTGKELFAQGIHAASPRSLGPFVAVNCAVLPENLLESEMFGYEKGTFTGALKEGKPGLFELAHGGTLFLDEIGEIPMRIQALLLRVLQERTIRRVGGERIIPVDVRIITATNRNLEEEVEKKEFRSDLFYRLNILALELPPLRQRSADIPMLVDAFVNEFNEKRKTKIIHVEKELIQLFQKYDWPGNIRELRNTIERMAVLEETGSLRLQGARFLSEKIRRKSADGAADKQSIKSKEKDLIISTLEKFGHNKKLAAQSLGIDRSTLWRKMKEYNL
ncbi:sigma-54-dependent Fis family transcriptional regulator [Neobacillus niacini]|uniref:sigma-54 interaction domain-containing protein n=1 Tax=Neobacillus niacini TaxID=86668 RepID=UPI0021CB4643|nr:sigma 54-interacting transcriptional regulator [Neobacillus niacini]MCM3766990.1 sigma 54-interacting transcriptional regulator [Neobacillus niacini]